jgi:excinuclease ABC subunit C
VLYIGRAVNLRRRVSSYWGDLADRPHLTPMVSRITAVQALECDSEHEAAWLERNLMERAMPRWNKTPGGQENEVWIRLDQGAAAPGIAVVHVPGAKPGVSHFGPYLGGSRVRLAVCGLLRAWPLHYCGDARPGTNAELGRQRGVGAGDRARLAAAVAAALARDRVAVDAAVTALVRRRDHAAGAEAYEVAAQIQAELSALDWIFCPQRMAVADGGAAIVCGWAEGLLIRLEIRDGRMCGWQQRAVPADAAQRQLAATPAAWHEFARRNAMLAARMAGLPVRTRTRSG